MARYVEQAEAFLSLKAEASLKSDSLPSPPNPIANCFPQPEGRGLIEVVRDEQQCGGVRGPFLSLKAEASLKFSGLALGVGIGWAFLSLKAEASLKSTDVVRENNQTYRLSSA